MEQEERQRKQFWGKRIGKEERERGEREIWEKSGERPKEEIQIAEKEIFNYFSNYYLFFEIFSIF